MLGWVRGDERPDDAEDAQGDRGRARGDEHR